MNAADTTTPGAPRLIYVVSEDWYFLSHRRGLAEAARAAGWDVGVATQVDRGGDAIRALGIHLFPVPLRRGAISPVRDLAYLARLWSLYRRERPAFVHHVAMKPALYGSIAAALAGVPAVVNTLAGMGYLFTHQGRRTALVRRAVLAAFRILFSRPNTRLILQNPADVATFRDTLGLPADRIALIPGSGVDLDAYLPAPAPPPGPVVIVMVSRLLRDKGVTEFIAAARLLKQRSLACRCLLAGGADEANPNAVPPHELDTPIREGVVECLGWRDDVAAIYRQAHIAVLPSYREGLPKSLIEAAACGLPIVTTDAPGCRDVVSDGVNGFLVPVRDAAALADRLATLARDPALRARFGAASRARAERDFDLRRIIAQTLALYTHPQACPG